jgi:hypothetical protein
MAYEQAIRDGGAPAGTMLGQAEPSLELDYGTFYSQMKTFAKEVRPRQTGLLSGQSTERSALRAHLGRVSTPDRDVPAEVTVDGELRLPYDEDLNLDKAIVVVGLTEAHAACDLSVQVMADAPATPARCRWPNLSRASSRCSDCSTRWPAWSASISCPRWKGCGSPWWRPQAQPTLWRVPVREAVSWQQGQLLLSNAQLKGLPRASCNCKGRSCV